MRAISCLRETAGEKQIAQYVLQRQWGKIALDFGSDLLTVFGALGIGAKAGAVVEDSVNDASNLLAAAQLPFKDGQAISNAGRAVTKHPEYFGFSSTEELRQVYRSDTQLNELAAESVQEVLQNGVKTTGAGGRYPNGWVTYTLPGGRAASWSALVSLLVSGDCKNDA